MDSFSKARKRFIKRAAFMNTVATRARENNIWKIFIGIYPAANPDEMGYAPGMITYEN